MEVKPWPSARHAAADLSKAGSFSLGPIRVDPPSRRVEGRERSEQIEPRVMRVLVALGASMDRVLTRDDLIDLCWDGQIVSDNAINRVISILRRVLEELGQGAVRLETITKVGFRIVVDETPGGETGDASAPPDVVTPAVAPELPPRTLSRRMVGGGILAAGVVAAGGYAAWTMPRKHTPDPRALDLYQRGQITQKSGLPGTMRQAVGHYKQAVEIDPDYPDAWAALAIGYRHGGDGFIKGPRTAYPRLVREAAQRALAVDPDNAEAQMALVSINPNFRHWLEQEANFRTIMRRHPDYWYGIAQLDLLLQDVGRFEEAISYNRRSLEIDQMIPRRWAMLARALHYAGRDQEAEIALDRGTSRWPSHPDLFSMRYHVLIGGKRYADAAALARDPRSLPEMLPEAVAQDLARTAAALAGETGTAAVAAAMRARQVYIETTPFTAPLMAELGETAAVFDVLEAYFFGGTINGKPIPPPDPLDARSTVVLFAPAILALKDDPRFAGLLQRTGLEDYWRKSGSRPDFRQR